MVLSRRADTQIALLSDPEVFFDNEVTPYATLNPALEVFGNAFVPITVVNIFDPDPGILLTYISPFTSSFCFGVVVPIPILPLSP